MFNPVANLTGDFYSLTTNDGQVLTLPNQQMAFVEVGGFGAPPVQWITKQGYKQHGETEVGYILQKRPVTLHLHFTKACSRAQYWTNRALIHDFLRHNRLGPLTLTILFNAQNYTIFDTPTAPSGATYKQCTPPKADQICTTNDAAFTAGMYIKIDQEIILVLAVHPIGYSGLRVARAQFGTQQVAHALGAPIFIYPGSGIGTGTVTSGKRSIIVRADPGLLLDVDAAREANWYIDESLKFVAFNPIWFDPNQIVLGVSQDSQQNLVFPITFPIVFGTAGISYTTTILYGGTWYEYPTITLTGPYQAATISNQTTGVSFTMNVPIGANQQRIITTTPGTISVVDAQGVNRFGELGPSSDLVDFNLKPVPEAVNGSNTLNCVLLGATSGSAFTVSFFNRFYGL